ncbi:hypothetical protein HK101_007938 [Irineochytrium annulatum]|nr:hypothetical protein HK101_007938 [Irineochytrium annulatum]
MTRVSVDLMDLDRRRLDTDACHYDSGFSTKPRSPQNRPHPLKPSLPFALSPTSPSKRCPPQNAFTSLEDAVASDAELDGIYRSQGMDENERRARIAIRHAFRTNRRLKESYMPLSVLGYGSNGVVLLAHVMGDPAYRVALKIIYRSRQFPPIDVPATTHPAVPNEIHLLRLLARDAPHPNVLLHLDDFSDARHHHLITELHADPTHLIPPTTTSSLHFHYDLDPSPTFQPLKHIAPLAPQTPTAAPATIRVHVHLPLAAGASDLWAWSNNHLHSPSSAFTSPAYTHPSFTIPLRPPPLPTTRAVFAQMASALHHLHVYNVYHGDVKEENLLISPISSKPDVIPSVKLCDFGHAGASGGDGVPRIRAYGTREMTAPELIAFQSGMGDAGDAGAEQGSEEGVSAFPCDVWALGLVLFALLHGPGCLPEVIRSKGWEESVVAAVSDGSVGGGGPVAFLPLGRVRPDLERDCLDLIRGMTVMDPARRLTMDEAGPILLSAFQDRSLQGSQVFKTSAADVVTATDKAIEDLIKKELLGKFPNTKFIGEESENGALTGEDTWVVDPVDGTTNFVHGLPFVCISIGLLRDRVPVLGVVHNPILSELYTALQGHGAHLNGRRLPLHPPNSLPDLTTALVATEYGYDRDEKMENKLDVLHSVLKENVRGVRSLGSAALEGCLVARGALDVYWEAGVHSWDVAAAVAIVREAGGLVVNFFPPEEEHRKDAGAGDEVEGLDLLCRQFLFVRAMPDGKDECKRVMGLVRKHLQPIFYRRD